MYSLRCDKCGWQEEMDSVLYTSCPNCNNQLIVENYGEDINPIELEQKIDNKRKYNKDVIYMRKMLNCVGNHTMWMGIENKSNYKERLFFRSIFFMAGGAIPQENTK